MLATEELAATHLDFYSTFGWHPVAVEAAIATQLYWREHRDAVLANVVARGAQLVQQLSLMEWQREPTLRLQGAAIAVELGDERYAGTIEQRCRDAGLLLFVVGVGHDVIVP